MERQHDRDTTSTTASPVPIQRAEDRGTRGNALFLMRDVSYLTRGKNHFKQRLSEIRYVMKTNRSSTPA